MVTKMIVRHLIVLLCGSICFGNLDGTYIAPLIDDTQGAPLVALLNTSDISRNILKSFGNQLNEKVNNSVNEKLADIDRRLQEIEENCRTTETDRSSGSGNRKDCSDLPKDSRSGIYRIKPDHAEELYVYCEMTVDRGGWTVIQRRESGDLDFYQGWTKYRTGFGQLHREFWLGNDKIHTLTSQGRYELLIGLTDLDNNQAYAKYQHFYIGNETYKYKINVYGYSGSAGDSLNYHNGMPFTTFDRDNDKDRGNCAQIVNGAWWFKDCLESDLNGHYFIRTPSQTWRGIIWKDWKGPNHSLRASEMMIRRL